MPSYCLHFDCLQLSYLFRTTRFAVISIPPGVGSPPRRSHCHNRFHPVSIEYLSISTILCSSLFKETTRRSLLILRPVVIHLVSPVPSWSHPENFYSFNTVVLELEVRLVLLLFPSLLFLSRRFSHKQWLSFSSLCPWLDSPSRRTSRNDTLRKRAQWRSSTR